MRVASRYGMGDGDDGLRRLRVGSGEGRRQCPQAWGEATSIFSDPNYLLQPDAEHLDRFTAIGISGLLRILVVVHIERGRRIRIISARKAKRQEATTYEKRRLI